MAKAQIAELYEITTRTLANYLNKRYYSELQKVGYRKNAKILTPNEIRKIVELIGMPLFWQEQSDKPVI